MSKVSTKEPVRLTPDEVHRLKNMPAVVGIVGTKGCGSPSIWYTQS